MTTIAATALSESVVDDHDIVIVDQDNLDLLDRVVDGIETVNTTIFTEDDHTQGRVEFNLIACVDGDYGIATQISDPISADDSVLDLREGNTDTFTDFIQGLA